MERQEAARARGLARAINEAAQSIADANALRDRVSASNSVIPIDYVVSDTGVVPASPTPSPSNNEESHPPVEPSIRAGGL